MATTTNPEVMAMVEDELRKDPKLSTRELFEKAKGVDPSIEELTSRQFHGRYPLQVKRRMAPKRERPRRRRTGQRRTQRTAARRASSTQATDPDADRTAIRGELLQFAKNIAAAESKADVVEVIGDVDRYVDKIVKAAGTT